MPDVNVQQVELANKYYNVLVQRAKEDGIKLDTRTLNIIKAKAQDAAAKKTQQSTPQQSFPTQGSERRVAKDAGQFESQGVAEGMFGIDSKTKGAIQNVVSKLSDIPGMWDHKAQTFTDAGMDKLKTVLKNNPKHMKYAVNLTADDFEADLEEMDRRGFLKGLGAVAATAAVPSLAQAGSAIDYNKVQMLHDQMFKKNPQYAKEWQAANGARVRAFIKSKDPRFRDRNTARKARLDMTAKILQKYGVKLNEAQFDPINDDDYYEYNVNTKEIVKRISGKHPMAQKFNPLKKEWPGRDADHKIIKGLQAKYLKDDVVDERVSDFLPNSLGSVRDAGKSVRGWRKERGLDESRKIKRAAIKEILTKTR